MKKKKMLAIGLALGVLVGGSGALTHYRRASAAVAVIDVQNIAEAIKTALNTANILTNEEKQLLLATINMKKIDAGRLTTYLKRQSERKEKSRSEQQSYEGALKSANSKDQFWNEMGGKVEDVVRGRSTVPQTVAVYQKAMQATERSNHDLLTTAKSVMEMSAVMEQQVADSLQDSSNAEGYEQALQANTGVNSVTANAAIMQNRQLATIANAEAARFQKENLLEAQKQAYTDQFSETVTSEVDAMNKRVKKPW